jgi:hypothetical protein
LPVVAAAGVVSPEVAVRADIELAQDFLLALHLPLLWVLVALLAVQARLILRELGQEPMAAPDQLLFFLLLLQSAVVLGQTKATLQPTPALVVVGAAQPIKMA